jgi:hypothetical protein
MDKDTLKKSNFILDILEEIETLLSKYYDLCALIFPEDSQLWKTISLDEINHSQFVAQMREALMERPDLFELGHIKLPVLKTFRQELYNQFIRLKKGEILRKNAFFIARDLENSMMEHQFYKVLEGGDAKFKDLKDRIIQETENHFQKIDSYIKKTYLEPD